MMEVNPQKRNLICARIKLDDFKGVVHIKGRTISKMWKDSEIPEIETGEDLFIAENAPNEFMKEI